jgi:hypothetical protein
MTETVPGQTPTHTELTDLDSDLPRRAKSSFGMPIEQARPLHEHDRLARRGAQANRERDRMLIAGPDQADTPASLSASPS